jgi:hypothetical protein
MPVRKVDIACDINLRKQWSRLLGTGVAGVDARVSTRAVWANLSDVEQNLPKKPQDARESTEEQRQQQERLEHQPEDPDGPGRHQSDRNVPNESTR